MRKIIGSFPSSSGICDCRFYIWMPDGQPKAALMLSHGMCEYIERYKDFAKFLCDNDIALGGNDHIGHGNSVPDENGYGYFGESRGYMNMVRDLHRMKRIMNKELPGIPHFLLGHSMGSFIARIYFSKYKEDRWNGVILMGTAGKMNGSAAMRKAIERIRIRRGSMSRPDFGTRVVFGMFNLRTENRRTRNDWLSRDDANVDKYCADPKCNFTFTAAGYNDLLNALICANSNAVIENTPADVPVLFLSGGMDPVGDYGRGVRSACLKYLEHGCDVKIRIYREARHELLFELNKQEVMDDILEFLVKRI